MSCSQEELSDGENSNPFIRALSATISEWARVTPRTMSMPPITTARMSEFEFSPSESSSWLQDIGDVLQGLEKAKAAMRAMGKYVAVDLVRRLYHECKEPVLGGVSIELSVMFTDIKGFTPFAEQTA